MNTLLTYQNADDPVENIDNVATAALKMNAHLHVLLVGVATMVPVTVYAEVPAYDWSASYTQIISNTQQKTQQMADHLNKLGVSATVVPICDAIGSIARVAADMALFADYAVVPATPANQSGDNLRRMFLEGAMFIAKTPTFLLPEGKTLNLPFNRIVIGWHPSPNTAAAVRSCLPLLNSRTDVNITVVDPTPEIYGQSPASEIAMLFSRRNVSPNIDLLSSNGKPVGEILVQHSIDINADLLVMGAFGHSRFREWLMGGTTRDVFEALKVPTLVSH